jgi:OmpR family response regulator RpaB
MDTTSCKSKILVADDDIELQKVIKAALKGVEAKIVFANNGKEAIDLFLSEKPELVILDIIMPKLSGWEVLKFIRNHEDPSNTKIIMLSGIGEDVNRTTSTLLGANDHVDKPFTIDDFSSRVRNLL